MGFYDRVCHTFYAAARRVLVPGLRNSQYRYAEVLNGELATNDGGRWLDVGCGHDFLPPWVEEASRPRLNESWHVVGVDPDVESLRRHRDLKFRVAGVGERIPLSSGSIRLLTANTVLEHVREPLELFTEISRVLVADGKCILHMPNVDGYTTKLTRLVPSALLKPLAALLLGRAAEDVYPTFYRANSALAVQELAATAGMEVLRLEYVATSPQTFRIPPLMLLEMMLIRVLREDAFHRLNATIVAVLRKTQQSSPPAPDC